METFKITATTNWDTQTSMAGGDITDINGGNLTINWHSRFDLNSGNTSTTAATSINYSII
jgi:hypothetical protein